MLAEHAAERHTAMSGMTRSTTPTPAKASVSHWLPLVELFTSSSELPAALPPPADLPPRCRSHWPQAVEAPSPR
jgi:hypothetical protein